MADASAIHVPVQVLIPGADKVVRSAATRAFFGRLIGDRHEAHDFPDLRHDILGERKRQPVVAHLRSFLMRCFEEAPAADLPAAYAAIEARSEETERLRRPLRALSLRGLYWRAQRAITRAGAHVSEGLRLGVTTGFDSGATLDYVYRNEARGFGPLGRMVDRIYLNAVGWRGIRQRKLHLEDLIGAALARLTEDGRPRRVVDLAAGHGRYVLDALGKSDHPAERVILRDFCADNVASGQRLIAERTSGKTATFEQGDAFDAQSVAKMSPRPSLAIVSGLYELFDSNADVARSLSGLAEAVESGDYLIYTNQPWHPQLELIARTLTSHKDGKPWVMRCRTQAEMDRLVEDAGFRKIEQRIDRWGIFSVSLAQRI